VWLVCFVFVELLWFCGVGGWLCSVSVGCWMGGCFLVESV